MKWEYKLITSEVGGFINRKIDSKTEGLLNELGDQNWELVSVAPLAGNTGTSWGANTVGFIFIFKRQKS